MMNVQTSGDRLQVGVVGKRVFLRVERQVGWLNGAATFAPAEERSYGVGDVAAYGGFNLFYLGAITSVGASTVTFGKQRRRLSLADFATENVFTVAEMRARNERELPCLALAHFVFGPGDSYEGPQDRAAFALLISLALEIHRDFSGFVPGRLLNEPVPRSEREAVPMNNGAS